MKKIKNSMTVAEILSNAPEDTSVYSPIFGYGKVQGIDDYADGDLITVEDDDYVTYDFYEDGQYSMNGEVMLFPSKEVHSWEDGEWQPAIMAEGTFVKKTSLKPLEGLFIYKGKVTDDDGIKYKFITRGGKTVILDDMTNFVFANEQEIDVMTDLLWFAELQYNTEDDLLEARPFIQRPSDSLSGYKVGDIIENKLLNKKGEIIKIGDYLFIVKWEDGTTDMICDNAPSDDWLDIYNYQKVETTKKKKNSKAPATKFNAGDVLVPNSNFGISKMTVRELIDDGYVCDIKDATCIIPFADEKNYKISEEKENILKSPFTKYSIGEKVLNPDYKEELIIEDIDYVKAQYIFTNGTVANIKDVDDYWGSDPEKSGNVEKAIASAINSLHEHADNWGRSVGTIINVNGEKYMISILPDGY